MKFGLTKKQYDFLAQKLVEPLRQQKARVWVFGSRARGDNQQFSDIDVLFELPKDKNFPPGFLFQIKDDLENSNFPFKIDLVDDHDLAQSYRDNVLKDRVEF